MSTLNAQVIGRHRSERGTKRKLDDRPTEEEHVGDEGDDGDEEEEETVEDEQGPARKKSKPSMVRW